MKNYEADVCGWAEEQVHLLREKRFDLIDLKNIIEEIEDVGKSEHRALAHRLVVLLAHLLKWKYQPAYQSASWLRTIGTQRKAIRRELATSPSLKRSLGDAAWLEIIWDDAVDLAAKGTGLDCFPLQNIWQLDQEVLSESWLP